MKRLLLIAVALCLGISVTFAWIFGNAMTARGPVPPSPLPSGATLVHVLTSDKLRLSGNFWPGHDGRAPGLLMLHGIGSSRQQFDEEAAAFAEKGYAVLAINLRAHGDSEGEVRSFGLLEGRDAHAAFDWLKLHQHGAKIGVIGSSLGGAAALLGEKGPLRADAMVLNVVFPDIHRAIRNRIGGMIGALLGWIGEPLLSYQAPLRFGVWPGALSPVSAIKEYHGAAFIIGGGKDTFTPPNETRELYDAAAGPKQLWIVPNADHNQTADNDDYMKRIASFFDQLLMSRVTATPSPS